MTGVSSGRSLRLALVATCLAALALAVFWPVTGYDFVAFDDDRYVTNNPWVKAGLGVQTAWWAFTSVGYAANWHPLAWISHQLDVSLFGLWPGGHHLVLRLVAEKIPLFVLAAGAGALTYTAQSRGGSVAPAQVLVFATRAMNAADAAVVYLRDTIFPGSLAILYPYPTHGWGTLPAARIALELGLLAGATALAFVLRRRVPALAAGWCWYLGMLLPVSGLIQAGIQARADRYTYLPLVGIFIALGWALPVRAAGWRRGAAAWGAAGVAAVLLLAVQARVQVGTWRDSLSLFRHAAAVTRNNWQAHANLGKALAAAGRPGEAVVAYREALRLLPYLDEERGALGGLLMSLGRPAEAVEELRAAVRARPELWVRHFNLGVALAAAGRRDEAVAAYRRAIELESLCAPAFNNLGTISYAQGRIEDARRQFREAVRIDPSFGDAHYNLGALAAQLGEREEAAARWEEVLRIDPQHAGARRELAALRSGNGSPAAP